MQPIVIYYYILINIFLFLLMGIDKLRAIKNKWRIREKTLIFTGFIGGGLGGLLAMAVFRHKTKKPLFKVSYTLAVIMHSCLIWLLFFK